MLVDLVRQYPCKVHSSSFPGTCHQESRVARAEGLPITVETCPHYLYFCAEDIPDGSTQFKWAPPIREAVNQALLWEAHRSGWIHMIAIDHSPYPADVVRRWMAERPAALAGLSSFKGRITAGCDADLVVFDPDASFEVAADLLHSRNNLPPDIGETLRGRVLKTILRGEIIYEEGLFHAGPIGREVH